MSTELFREKKTVEYIPVKFSRKQATCNHASSEYFYTKSGERVEACTRCGETDKWKLDPSGGCF